jgi:hypothetical protein
VAGDRELRNLYSSPNIVTMLKSRRMIGWACSTHREIINLYRIFVGKPEGKRPIRRPILEDGRIILKWILRK